MLRSLTGLDHLVIAVRDLDAARDAWANAGFTVSPRGTHSAQMGSANHTIMFGQDYIELLGVIAPTPVNTSLRRFLDGREGLERFALTTTDAEAGHAALSAAGQAPPEVLAFSRPVPMPGGGSAEARFSVLRWPEGTEVAGLGLFACQHHTPEAVWLPALTRHDVGVTAISRVLVASPEAEQDATRLAGLIGAPARRDGALWLVPTGDGRADLALAPRAALAAAHALPEAWLPERGGAGAVLRTAAPRPPLLLTGTALAFVSG